ncbi:MAG: carboxypeptidase regulatory-like domain-containing protein [Deltaproteobacteria bacterium]|nr:carboxypeptidase regulatory-like domain-containing protein [Deltaproteobacteria bacterium]
MRSLCWMSFVGLLSLLDLVACTGDAGVAGPDGAPGKDGADCTLSTVGGVKTITCPDGSTFTVTDGQPCWDLNGNGAVDVTSEDKNGDGAVDVEDCEGTPGTTPATTGTISGVVRNAAGTLLEGVGIETSPASTTTTSDASGAFSLAGVAMGSYAVIGKRSGYADYNLPNVGVAAGATTNVQLALTPGGPGAISGVILNANGEPVSGATVSVQGQAGVTPAVTTATGAYALSGVAAGSVFLSVAPPAGNAYLPGENHDGIFLAAGATLTGVDMTIASRPSNAATYSGTAVCVSCHASLPATAALAADYAMAAHGRSISGETSGLPAPGTGRVLDSAKALFPAVDGTTSVSFQALDPTDGVGLLPVFLCNNTTDGNYSMKFDGTSCTDGVGTIIPISGTYGGEGDGGVDLQPNLGKFKQRFLAKLADVPVAAGWTYTAGKARDYLILPVQVTQSGDGAPLLAPYKETSWCGRDRTFSRACAGCHVVGLKVVVDSNFFVTSYEWANNSEPKSQNVGCESCHGPGSEHVAGSGDKLKVINPKYLTAEGERQVCAQCHAADAGKSKDPDGKFGYAWNQSHLGDLGNGAFVAGVYNVADYIKGFGVPMAQGGGFDAWPDGKHGKAHRQQYAMLAFSAHTNNPYEKLTCSSCHNVHSTVQGPAAAVRQAGADTFTFHDLTFDNNTLCLSCHAGYGPFAALTKEDVAKLHVSDTGTVDKNATLNVTYTAAEITPAMAFIAAAVSEHMQDQAGMGLAAYDPKDDVMPVGRCTSCHMPRTGKSGGFTTGLDGDGLSALAAGDEGSHAFDIIWPGQSAVLKKATGGVDTDIMPNSCGGCHAAARLSGN